MTTNIWESTDRQLTWPEAVTKRWCSKGGDTYEQDLQSYLQSGKELLCGYIRICQSTYEKCRESHAGLGYCRYDGWGVIVWGGSFAALSTTEVSTSAGGTATVLSGEPSDVVTDVSGAGATLTVTKGDGSSTTVVVNNVANATEAEKAVSDKDGNDISTTYLKTADAETTYATKTELEDKANTADVYSKTEADTKFATVDQLQEDMSATNNELANKANTADVYSKTDADATFATKTEMETKADKTEVYTRTEADETFATKTALQAQANHDQANVDALSGAINNGLAVDENNTLQKITSSVDADGNVTTSVNPADTLIINKDGTNAVTIDTTGLSVGTGTKMDASGVYAGGSNSTDAAAALNADGSIKGASGNFTVDTSGNLNTHAGKISTEGGSINTGTGDINTAGGQLLTGGGTINTSGGSIIGGAITGTSLNTQGGEITGGNITATGLNTQGGAISSGDINSTGAIHASGKITGNGLDANGGSVTGGSLSVTGSMAGHDLTLSGGNLNAGSGTISTTGNVEAGNITSTGTIKTSNLEVTGDFATDHMTIGHETNNKTDINKGNISAVNGVITTNIADQSVKASALTFTEDGYKAAVAGHGATSNSGASTEVTMNGVTNTSMDSLGNSSVWSQTPSGQTATTTDSTGARSEVAQSSSQYGSSIYDSSGNLKSYITQRMAQIIQGVTDGTTTTTIDQGPANITNTASNGSITNEAMTLVNNATADMTNTVGGKLVNNVTGNMENTIGGDLKNVVTGDVSTEGTNITSKSTADMTNTVGGKLVNNVTGNMENTVGGDLKSVVTGDVSTEGTNITSKSTADMTNTVGGKLVNNVTGNMENTIGGDLNNVVTGDVSTEGTNITSKSTADMTNTVGGKLVNNVTGNLENTVGGDLKSVVTGDVSTEGKNISSTATADMTNTVGGKLVNNVTGNLENTVGGDLKNVVTGAVSTEGKTISNQATESIVDMVGSNVSRTMTGNKIIESVADGNESNVSTRTAKKAMSVVSDGTNTTTVSQLSNGYNISLKAVDASGNTTKSLTDKKTVDEDVTKMADAASGAFSSRSQKTLSIVDIVKGADGTTNTVSNEASGTTFENSAHNTPVGEGTITRTTIAGNTVETGSVTMDYAEVMKDLGVRGNAVIDGNTSVGGTLEVTGKATFHDDVDIAKNLNVAGNASVSGDVTAASFKVGNETYISSEGINANNKKITNVAPGELSPTSMDAVNGSQLYNTNQRVSKLDSRLDKVGANAAALANLNPLEFDKDTKLNVAAAVGNYKDETAAAVGVYYRPNEDVMLGVSTSFGTGENMVGGGISVRVGHGGNKSARAATENAIKENEILRREVKNLEARMNALLSVLNPNMSKEFPDVPANHWAYEAVSRLAGNGIVEGYKDGKYHGERQMTRYEMAEIIYKALSKGVKAEKELIDEFRPELQAMAASNKA